MSAGQDSLPDATGRTAGLLPPPHAELELLGADLRSAALVTKAFGGTAGIPVP